MIVTIDGPAGSGKSTAARKLAERLGFDFLDTGAMYRAVALATQRRGLDAADAASVETALPCLAVTALAGRVTLNGEDVSAAIRTLDVSQGASQVAVIAAVRTFLVAQQRLAGRGRNIVTEGRDQGSVVFPDAECKFFLTADPVARAERRLREQTAMGATTTLAAVLAAQEERDARDAARDHSPMRPAADAVILDTTHLSADDVLARLESEVLRRCPNART